MHNYADKKRDLGIFVKISIFFQNPLMYASIGLFLFGVLTCSIFYSIVDFSDAKFKDTNPETTGKLIARSATKTMVNDVYVYEFTYEYSPPTGIKTIGKCYATGSQNNLDSLLTVEYLVNEPEISRIKNMRRGQVSPWILYIFAVFPFLGIFIAFLASKKGLKQIRKLEYWSVTKGTFISIEETSKFLNKNRLFNIAFSYVVHKKKQTQEIQIISTKTKKLISNNKIIIVYNEHTPSDFLVVDVLNKAVRNYFTSATKP